MLGGKCFRKTTLSLVERCVLLECLKWEECSSGRDNIQDMDILGKIELV